ncbi:hypothetical protein PIB30_057510 [Stylosanthes scabra]|uniref:Uncharacterized protein n=1 Tax=Stylosanthes scabra TaxID=79078 RepID=A0ABU6ZIF3_9FABA|nr:hypothetical protein [Stylosanthes scabra]
MQNDKVEIETNPKFCINDLNAFDDPFCIIVPSHISSAPLETRMEHSNPISNNTIELGNASSHASPSSAPASALQPVRRSTREIRKPAYLADFQRMATSSDLPKANQCVSIDNSEHFHEKFFEQQFETIEVLKQNFFEQSTILVFESAVPDSIPLILISKSSFEFINQTTTQPIHKHYNTV